MFSLLKTLGWVDVVEIILVWIFFYYAFILIRGTRAVQVLKGLGILLAITFLAYFLELRLIAWAMDKLWTTFIVVLVILFHPEIRRALARLGQRKLFRFEEGENEPNVIAEVVKAVSKMAALRIGALIVFEREMGLKGHIDTGVIIDSRVSAEALQSIFYPNTPLHDGAVIISQDRLLAASCILPLPPDDMVIDSALGTRHRAAIGLSLETDACIVVVSEETGGVSIVLRGEIESEITEENLRQQLAAYNATGKLTL